MNNYTVSIICTCYNYGKYIGEAIESFLNQKTTFPVEIIIVDDCSTDDSAAIINSYAQKHPDSIRFYRNSQNKGITRTWVDICKEAQGKYIARCDADDCWTDEYKLQKQVDLLEQENSSKWCNTDSDFVDENGEVIIKSIFESGSIPYANTYEKMLATKGFTSPSTWLVDTELMLEVNEQISEEYLDDTFQIQLELFMRTELSYITDSCVARRMNHISDSNSYDVEKQCNRSDQLLKAQKKYIEKYPQANLKELSMIMVESLNELEKTSIRHQGEIDNLRNQVQAQEETFLSLNNTISLLNDTISSQKNTISALKIKNQQKKKRIENLQKKNKAMRDSLSWKITSPLRKMKRKLKGSS